MKKPTIVCVSGKARHGKDEFCSMAVDYLSQNFKVQQLAFGDWVKYTCSKYYDI